MFVICYFFCSQFGLHVEMANTVAKKKLLVIDCDAGIDDAHAIMVALSNPDTEVLALTCVKGNVSVNQVWYNVHRVLDACDKQQVSRNSGGMLRGAPDFRIFPLKSCSTLSSFFLSGPLTIVLCQWCYLPQWFCEIMTL